LHGQHVAGSLGDDPDLYQRRYEKTASALIAIAQTLEEKRPLGGAEAEFLRLYDAAASANAEDFTRVWTDPLACYWTTLGYQLLGGCFSSNPLPPLARDFCASVRADDARAALRIHLREFARLALGLAVVGNRELAIREPLEVELPFAIPATRWSLAGEGPVAILGVADGELRVRREGRDCALSLASDRSQSDGILLEQCPVARCDDLELRLQPAAFQLPGVEFARVLNQLPAGYQSEQEPLVSDALSLVRRHQPEVFEHIRAVLQFIALKPPRLGDSSNSTHSDLPGSFVLAIVDEPYTLADSIIHEFFHNRLFFIEDEAALFEDTEYTLSEKGSHYSPWRPDPRPAQGIFHGFYVYLPVCRFWLEVVRSGETRGILADYAADQVVRSALQVRMGEIQLEHHARFTARGAALFRALRADFAQLRGDIDALGLPADLPAITCTEAGVLERRGAAGGPLSVREDVLEHLRKARQRGLEADAAMVLERL
jgi:HEXXH motif-containing protein